MKGTSFEICFMKFGKSAKAIEDEANDLNKVKDNYEALISEWEKVKIIIDKELK